MHERLLVCTTQYRKMNTGCTLDVTTIHVHSWQKGQTCYVAMCAAVAQTGYTNNRTASRTNGVVPDDATRTGSNFDGSEQGVQMGYHANHTTSYGARYRKMNGATHTPRQNNYENRFKFHET